MRAQWAETFVGGSPEAEQQHFEKLARDIMRVQLTSSEGRRRARRPARRGPRLPREVDAGARGRRPAVPRRPRRRPAGRVRAAGCVVPGDGAVLQRLRRRRSGHRARPARGRAAGRGLPRRVARPADDQLAGLARPRRTPVRRVRQGHRRRQARRAPGHPAAAADLRPDRDPADAPQRDAGPAPHGHQRGDRDLLEPRRDALGTRPRRALPAPARRGHPGRSGRCRRTTPATSPRRRPVGSPRATCTSSSASSGSSTSSRHPSRTPAWPGTSASRAPSRSPC